MLPQSRVAKQTLVPPPSSPPRSFLNRVKTAYSNYVDRDSPKQRTIFINMLDSVQHAQSLKGTQNPVSEKLEEELADMSELITSPCIVRDKNNIPVLGLFPRCAEQTHCRDYV
jgi:hypothetical protein